MATLWSGSKPAPKPENVVQGRTGRYGCKSVSSVDVHLCQLAKRLIACETASELEGLLWDRDLLLEARLDLARGGRTAPPMPSLSDAG